MTLCDSNANPGKVITAPPTSAAECGTADVAVVMAVNDEAQANAMMKTISSRCSKCWGDKLEKADDPNTPRDTPKDRWLKKHPGASIQQELAWFASLCSGGVPGLRVS